MSTRREQIEMFCRHEMVPSAIVAELRTLWAIKDAVNKHASDHWIGMKRLTMGSPEMVPFDDTPETIMEALDAYNSDQKADPLDPGPV